METGAVLLLLLAGILVVLIILQIRYTKKERARGYEMPPAESVPPGWGAPPTGPVAAPPAGPTIKTTLGAPARTATASAADQPVGGQVTFYRYDRRVPVRICPCCDGENDAAYGACCICGQKFA